MSQNANSHYTCKKDEGQLTRYLYFILRLLPSARCLRHTLGVRINDIMLRVSIQVLLPSSFISVSKKVIFHLQRWTSSTPTNWRETIWYIWHLKIWYILIQDISRPQLKTDKWPKNTKGKKTTLIQFLLLWIKSLASS